MITDPSNTLVFRCKIALLGGILLFAASIPLISQENSLGEVEVPGIWEKAVVMHIVSRIVEQNQQVVWDMENTRITMPGRPVGLRLLGSDLVVVVQFTPFLRSDGRHILVAQGQIWINIPDEGISYHTTMQTIPLEFQEQVYFFPLGSIRADDEAHIEIQLVLEPYSGEARGSVPETSAELPKDHDSLPAIPRNRGWGEGWRRPVPR
jgi:hypothetical protein